MLVRLGNARPKTGYREAPPEGATADELRDIATARGIDSTGNKAELATRIADHLMYRETGGYGVTTANIPDSVNLGNAFKTITDPGGVYAAHSDEAPAWVESDSDGLAMLLSEHYGCPIGEPAGWDGATPEAEYSEPEG